jgi:hypothetical protein
MGACLIDTKERRASRGLAKTSRTNVELHAEMYITDIASLPSVKR